MKTLLLPDGVVHVWRASLEAPAPEVLSADEREKAAQFHFEKDRRPYMAARGILRQLIGRYENLSPEVIQFTYNTFGKPGLNGTSLRFNTSHSGDVGLFAFTRHKNIGVDLERIRPDFAAREIAGQFFSPDEIAALRALPPEAFFTCWTRKEAFIKAHGSGMSLPLHQFSVSLDQPARLLRTDFDPAAIHQWTLHDLPVPEGFAAALALEGNLDRIEYREFDGGQDGK